MAEQKHPLGLVPDVYQFIAPAAESEINENTCFDVKVLAPDRDPSLYQVGCGVIPEDPMTPIVIVNPVDPPTVSDPGNTYPEGHKFYTYTCHTPSVDADGDLQIQFLYRSTTLDPWQVKRTRVIRVKNV